MMENPKQLSGPDISSKVRNSSLNALMAAPERPDNEGLEQPIEGLHLFSDEIISRLPEGYKRLVQARTYATDKTATLFNLLVLCSGTLPNIFFRYGTKKYYLSMMGYHIAPPATGKGNTSVVRKILESIHNEYSRQAAQALEDYKEKLSEWKRQSPKRRGIEPEKPLCPLLIFPDNTTKPKFMENLQASDGRGIIIGQEADTTTQANKGEHGGFSDIWRKAAEHEPLSVGTKQDGNIELLNPQLAVLMTSTPMQTLGMFSSIEDGLTSRFAYLFWPNDVADKIQDPCQTLTVSSEDYETLIKTVGSEVAKTYWELIEKPEIEWTLTKEQNQRSINLVKQYSKDIKDTLTMHNGSDKRMPIILYRIAVHLDTRRRLEKGETLSGKIQLSDWAFDLAFELMSVLWQNALEALSYVAKVKQNTKSRRLDESEKQLIKQYISDGLSDSDISRQMFGNDLKRELVRQYRKKLTNLFAESQEARINQLITEGLSDSDVSRLIFGDGSKTEIISQHRKKQDDRIAEIDRTTAEQISQHRKKLDELINSNQG